jgi:tRNA(fMet)-specific endonuclease VapC
LKIALDTNAYRLVVDGDRDAEALVQVADFVGMPVPVIAELRYGFANGSRGRRNEAVLAQFLDTERVHVLDCDEQTTHYYAQLKLQLKRAGTPIPLNDVWIAALALQHQTILFTRDRDFEHIPQLPRI